MWFVSSGKNLTFLSNESISNLSFDMICSEEIHQNEPETKCRPYLPPEDSLRGHLSVSPTTLIFQLLGGENTKHRVDLKHFAQLLGSVMMNGLPLLGLDDFVHSSDFINQNLEEKTHEYITKSSFLSGQFGNFLNIRKLHISLSPNNCWTNSFLKYLKKTSSVIKSKSLEVKVYKSMYHATLPTHCCRDVWIHIEIMNKYNQCPKLNTKYDPKELELLAPAVTFRLHPASIPDSRNKIWSPRKHGGGAHGSLQTGQLLYFTSGFLTMQLEIQNFLSLYGLSRPVGTSSILSSSSISLAGIPLNSNSHEIPLAQIIAECILSANSTTNLFQSLSNLSPKLAQTRPILQVPLYDRAYPTRGYLLDMFWHKLPEMISIVLIVYVSLPAALVASYFCRQSTNGQFDSLFSLPSVTIISCLNGWVITCCLLLIFPFIFAFLFFSAILKYTSPLLPAFNLLLLGFSLAPISLLISLLVKRAETAVIIVPIVTFITLLPGLLYYDLAYDVQRGTNIEIFLCLLPPSAGVMILRMLCSLEAYHSPLHWVTPALVSNVPLYWYTLMLVIDFLLYYGVAHILAMNQFQTKEKIFFKRGQPLSELARFQDPQPTKPKSWINLAKLGIPLLFLESTPSYLPIPEEDDVTLDKSFFQGLKENEAAIIISSLSKSYETLEGYPVEVLKNLNGELKGGSITTLLGSNGAGKTTLMRILGGLDAHYSGFVGYNIEPGTSRRVVGWCAQSDPLFEYLTVKEHLRLFFDLLGNTHRHSQIESQIYSMLQRLDLLDHADKDIQLLSGGMKRRLSLLLACLGDPHVLLLDEPTSGCDSYTRELVRKDILARKHHSAVLISTHHIDDVEIISDQVWFLNEHNLIYNGSLSQLHEKKVENVESYQAQDISEEWNATAYLEFTTSSIEIRQLFMKAFPNLPKANYSVENSLFSCLIPSDTPHNISVLRGFLAQIESQSACQWSLISPNAYKSLSRMYDITERAYSRDFTESHDSGLSNFWNWIENTYFGMMVKRLLSLIILRIREIKAQHSQFVSSQLILPFVIVLLLVFACSDVRFPKLELQSSSIGGIGEILVSNGANRMPIDLDFSLNELSKDLTPFYETNNTHPLNDPVFHNIKDTLGDSLSWRGSRSSEELFVDLYSEYFVHNDKSRWVSFVLDDTVQNWLQSRVRITKSAFKLSLQEILKTLSELQTSICGLNHTHTENISNISWPLQFCDNGTAKIEISLVNQTSNSFNGSNFTDLSETIMITVYQSLHSNLTMMTNITTDHGSPIFLKEIVPYIFDWRSPSNNLTSLNFSRTLSYTLFSHPFDDATDSSSTYIQRGYLGALMIILYLLLISTVSVRFITNNKNSGAKTQFHLCGVSPSIYWISNLIVDTLLLFSTFFCVYIAIWFGGPPIRNFFFSDEPESGRPPGFLFLLTLWVYSWSSVSANYCCAVLSKDQISSQLFSLITTICSGLFLKFFISLQGTLFPYPIISVILTCLFPSYAFSSCLFEMFTRYVKQLGKTVGILDVGFQLNWNDVYFPIFAMCVQTIAYLFLTVLVDVYWYRWICYWEKLSSNSVIFQWMQNISTLTRNRLRSLSDLTLRHSLDHYLQIVSLTSSQEDFVVVEETDPYFVPTFGKGIERKLSESLGSNEPTRQGIDLLNLEDLSVKYQHSSVNVLKELNLKIQSGERIALMGINGGGKSSLFKTLSTDEMISVSGNASICGYEIVENYWKLCKIGAVGYVPQDGGLLDYLTVKEAIDLFIGLKGVSQIPLAHIQSIFSVLPKKYLSYTINSLSGGNKKKLSVVLSNITRPSILLLDEPTSGVDPAAAERIVQYLSSISSSQGIIFASHRLDECLRICKRVFMLYSGRIQFDGKMSLFDSISDLFYQIDIGLNPKTLPTDDTIHNFLRSFADFVSRSTSTPNDVNLFERIVVYNDSLIRITCEKYLAPLSIVWKVLQEFNEREIIIKYSFRRMDMEEIFAILQAGTDSDSRK